MKKALRDVAVLAALIALMALRRVFCAVKTVFQGA